MGFTLVVVGIEGVIRSHYSVFSLLLSWLPSDPCGHSGMNVQGTAPQKGDSGARRPPGQCALGKAMLQLGVSRRSQMQAAPLIPSQKPQPSFLKPQSSLPREEGVMSFPSYSLPRNQGLIISRALWPPIHHTLAHPHSQFISAIIIKILAEGVSCSCLCYLFSLSISYFSEVHYHPQAAGVGVGWGIGSLWFLGAGAAP